MAKKKPKGASDAARYAEKKAALDEKRATGYSTKSVAASILKEPRKFRKSSSVNDVIPPPKRPGRKS